MTGAENIRSGEIFADAANSRGFDRRLFDADARARAAHCDALFHAGILTRAEAERIKNGLQAILKRGGYDKNYFSETSAADVHALVETRLAQLVGDAALKLNVGAARADHAATVFRLWLREEIEKISASARALQAALVGAAERARAAVLPGGARSQNAPPVLWAHWCLSYFERLARDRERLDEVWRRVNIMPLGAGGGAGTNFEIDREQTARDLGFEGVSANSLDAVSDADYAFEFVSACALAAAHLAGFAGDLILFSSDELSCVEFSLENNPNFQMKISGALDFLSVKAGRIFGHQVALAARSASSRSISGAAFKELQESVFDAADAIEICLKTAKALTESLRVGKSAGESAAAKNSALAAELADYLLHKNVPYQTVCEAVEKISSYAAASGKRISEISLEAMRKFSAQIEPDIFDALTVGRMLAGKSQIGGTAPERVFEALEAARASLEMEQ